MTYMLIHPPTVTADETRAYRTAHEVGIQTAYTTLLRLRRREAILSLQTLNREESDIRGVVNDVLELMREMLEAPR